MINYTISLGNNEDHIQRTLDADFFLQHGWYYHIDSGKQACHLQANIHTHGLFEKYGHPDFQVTIFMSDTQIEELFGHLVAKLEQGHQFKAKQNYDGLLINNQPLSFLMAQEDRRKVLRVIIRDQFGKADRPPLLDNSKT